MQFYWRHARESLLTPTAIRMFQIFSSYEGQVFDKVKNNIDDDYEAAMGKTSKNLRHGGIIQSQVQVFREAGWATINKSGLIEITDAGRQALTLFTKSPDFLKVIPFFILELLSRLQLNNPARPTTAKNAEYDAELKESTVFPYWTLFKIIRSCDNYISAEELRRFVFQIKKHEDIQFAIESIKRFRNDQSQGKTEDELNKIYPLPLQGANGEPKYLMGRLGTQVGSVPPVLQKDGASIWRLNDSYTGIVDQLLNNEPLFKEYLDEKTWIRDYGKSIDIEPEEEVLIKSESIEPLVSELSDDDSYLSEVLEIIKSGGVGVLFSGPPGTSKSWYARQIAIKLVEGDSTRLNFVQFHPSMSYDDFVEGYVPIKDSSGTSFDLQSKVFLKLCRKAKEVSPKLCVLVIDEINRGDTSRIFGELLTYIEASYRDLNFTASYSNTLISIPKNLFIIGTFNPFDRSIVELDDAMDRRFEKIGFEPSPQLLATLLKKNGVEKDFIPKVSKYFVDLNRLTRHGIGHTLFMSIKDDQSLLQLWNRKLKFILEKAFRFDPGLYDQAKQDYLSLFSDQESIKL